MGGKYLKNNKGFTLTEAIILVVIVSIFMSAILPFIVENMTANARSKKRLMAYEAAYTEMEHQRSKLFSTLTSESFTPANVSGGTGQVTVSTDINGDGQAETDIVKDTVNVTYVEKGQNKTISLSTLITKKGITSNE